MHSWLTLSPYMGFMVDIIDTLCSSIKVCRESDFLPIFESLFLKCMRHLLNVLWVIEFNPNNIHRTTRDRKLLVRLDFVSLCMR